MYDFEPTACLSALKQSFHPDAALQLAHPFETLPGVDGFFEQAILPLAAAFPDLERRDTIVMAGRGASGALWVGCCGYYTGCFKKPFLDIPPTGHFAAMRFHEFYRIDDGRITEMQALWDIPELMMQAGAWPMAPSLGREWHVPAPATQDGLTIQNRTPEHAEASLNLVDAMLEHLTYYAEKGVAGMQLEKRWHPRCSWYGPAGIGSCRGIEGFRHWHQIPFLSGMPDRRGGTDTSGHLFADGDYVAFTAWPGMSATITGDGWMGIAPAGQEITMRTLDFWRCEDGMIRENWVIVDLLHIYQQIGVDVLARMREFNKARL